MNKINKDNKYVLYLIEHIDNVKTVWKNIKKLDSFLHYLHNYCDNEFTEIITLVDVLIDKHDQSKFKLDEFNAYRDFFYTKKTKEVQLNFNYAWNYHKNRNPHHWQYWMSYNNTHKNYDVLEMPIQYVLEMLCDWGGMSLKFKDTPSKFYNTNKDEIILHKNTKTNIIKLLPYFDKIIGEINGK